MRGILKLSHHLFLFFCLFAQNAWGIELSLFHEKGLRQEVRDRTSLEVVWDWNLSENRKIRVDQIASRLYDIRPPETEFSIEDTLIYYYQKFTDTGFSLRLGLTAPLSQFSRTQGVLTKVSATLQMARTVIPSTWTLATWPYFQYQINRYTTSVDGTPHTKFRLGNTIHSDWQIGKGFSHRLIFDAAYVWSESPIGSTQDRVLGKYSWETYIGYGITSDLDARLGYLQGDDFTKNGRYEILFFDPNVSVFYAALDYRL